MELSSALPAQAARWGSPHLLGVDKATGPITSNIGLTAPAQIHPVPPYHLLQERLLHQLPKHGIAPFASGLRDPQSPPAPSLNHIPNYRKPIHVPSLHLGPLCSLLEGRQHHRESDHMAFETPPGGKGDRVLALSTKFYLPQVSRIPVVSRINQV